MSPITEERPPFVIPFAKKSATFSPLAPLCLGDPYRQRAIKRPPVDDRPEFKPAGKVHYLDHSPEDKETKQADQSIPIINKDLELVRGFVAGNAKCFFSSFPEHMDDPYAAAIEAESKGRKDNKARILKDAPPFKVGGRFEGKADAVDVPVAREKPQLPEKSDDRPPFRPAGLVPSLPIFPENIPFPLESAARPVSKKENDRQPWKAPTVPSKQQTSSVIFNTMNLRKSFPMVFKRKSVS